jgi:hypothetical protein
MSDLRIALVAEGPTDYEIIHAALRAVLPQAFMLTLLQPEATRPAMGGGWGGVLKWCLAANQRHVGKLDTDPTLSGFDLLIIHLDVDVAHRKYDHCGPEITAMAQEREWHALPCQSPCPPVSDTCIQLEAVLNSWLGHATAGETTLYCLPAQSSGSWLAAAVLPLGHILLAEAECNVNLESQLALLPKNERIKKNVSAYRQHAPRITEQWATVKQVCSRAVGFEEAVLTAMGLR